MILQKTIGFLLGLIFLFTHPALAEDWSELKDEHFVVFYPPAQDSAWARKVLWKAESYYEKIATQIGYSRYSDFWTWDERVKIIIFENQESYLRKTGQPQWSTGYSNRDSRLFNSRVIVTYYQENDFLPGLLPHEISHLILRDFIGFDREIPIWFDEGVAQFYEEGKKEKVAEVIGKLVNQKQFIPMESLNQWDVRQETDPRKVSLFYIQSVSVVDFLMREYGFRSFALLCRNLKEGKDMESALLNAYSGSINSLRVLEDKWVRGIRK